MLVVGGIAGAGSTAALEYKGLLVLPRSSKLTRATTVAAAATQEPAANEPKAAPPTAEPAPEAKPEAEDAEARPSAAQQPAPEPAAAPKEPPKEVVKETPKESPKEALKEDKRPLAATKAKQAKPAEAAETAKPAKSAPAAGAAGGELAAKLAQVRKLLGAADHRGVIVACTEILQQDPRNAFAYRSLGIAYSSLGARPQACESYRRYLRFAGNPPDKTQIEGIIAACK